MPTNNLAYTAPINPTGTSLRLHQNQIWTGLKLKIRSAETFVPNAISSTTVLSESTDPNTGNEITVREVVFVESQRKAQETVEAFEPSRVIFKQQDGSTISNIISEDAHGELFMTYTFEWRHPDVTDEENPALLKKEKKMSRMAVEGTIAVLRRLVDTGKI
ncbi:unnamed protein product [Penicillium salamii]|uniref:DUF1857-domain-containing protein n=1 Tax=Penicillium salamii TaxID=1612424 RepID=A0A9W4NJ23_9EURO|nr:unnamed protein product [Penicillium salamii]CAG8160758.1 unnamed protein product [Penicillium salamii]CAG8373342.1 unnamed protein product [Penicillium salamii]CAG8381093.1 unnamed protein product [Penicillium salamii]CAG8383009.1 unnamed protein product [Penicillium salamii]